ncbi:plastocyanin/azurin family copper-binding protein [Hydrogenophaga taeniospiralis]|uniref:cupredoxin domain-containing protein n=1 Tax=Hydrogenophaga taeniospiralis TaxID=65656 RepID=UPI001CFA1295|nr:cupredoxin family protein [Hydrogenophaga taeniospiralis]UCU93440.1 cupredoxin family protein [Hydrogenophaga taeniospiralis]
MKIHKFNIVSRAGFVFAAAALAASVALAGGNHGSGHHDESPIGQPGVAKNVTRTIEVDAADSMRFTPSTLSVKKGETIRFVIKNSGKVPHEFSLGTERELMEHYEVMKKFPNMEHEEANKISLKPGKQGDVIWRFTKAGVVNFACLHVGHYEAGMKGEVNVAAK